MSRWLLDTDHASLQERGHPILRERLAAVSPDDVAVSVVTMEEMLRGRLAVLKRHRSGDAQVRAYSKLLETVQFFSSVPVVPYDPAADERFRSLWSQRLRVGSQDLRIASVALVHGLVVVTRNHKDFGRVPGLRLEDWTVRRGPRGS